ncbi:MAG: hypothetical protein IJW75_00440 [Alphaproteobacteria bacterium]|nr:hypothetical protein [Alphaproteobacteria bacterium]
MSDLATQKYLEHFFDDAGFSAFCLSQKKDRIKRMTTKDWLGFFRAASSLAEKLGYKDRANFLSVHNNAFNYMYSNYCPDKRRSRKIKKFAYQMADKLATSQEFAQLYYDVDIAVWRSQKDVRNAAKIIRDEFFLEYTGSEIKANLLKPRVLVRKQLKKDVTLGGYYKQNILLPHEIAIRENVPGFCNITAHELYHSMQRLGTLKRFEFLKKIGVTFEYDKQMAELYQFNNSYYINGLQSDKGYKKQPLEYDARLFAACFERRLRKNLKAAENNWGLLYQTVQVLRSYQISSLNIQYDEEGISVLCSTDEKRHISFLEELNSKHLTKAQIFYYDPKTHGLYIPRDKQNSIAINKLYTNSTKSGRKGDDVFMQEFVKRFFPQTYNKFHATAEEKIKRRSVLSSVTINRLGSSSTKR